MQKGGVSFTPDLLLGGLCGVMGLRYWPINRDNHSEGDRAPGWRSTCGQWGVRGELWRIVE